MVNSRSLDDLHPHVKDLCGQFIAAALASTDQADVLITSTYRDFACQTTLYQQGRMLPGAIVTNAKAGESFHNYHLAFDFVPLVLGKCSWGDSGLFTRLGIIGERLGLTWAGRWTGPLREMAHLQWTGGLTIADLQAGKQPPDA
jgi:peptidoglycan L-alanyl-D-glutamate endopeptidase CwlK